jgi:predicted AAA+ superfamily ATPase
MSQDSTASFMPAIPADDIDLNGRHLKRESVVKDLIELAMNHMYVVLGAPPASGKTSLLRLIEEQLKQRGALVIKLALRKHRSTEWAFQQLKRKGVDFDDVDELTELKDAWILLDDAQNWYAENYWSFWQTLVKDCMSAKGKLFFIFSATYDLATPDSPVHFGSLEHFARLSITSVDVQELFS